MQPAPQSQWVCSAPQASPPSIRTFQTDTADLSLPEHLAVGPRAIRSFHPERRRALPGASRTGTPHPNIVQQQREVGGVTGLSGGHQDAEWMPMSVTQDVDCAGSSPTTDAKPLIRHAPLFFVRASCFRAPTAVRWALTWVLSMAAPSQSILLSSSALTWSAARIASQVPFRDQRVKRSWHTCHDPYRSVTSRQGVAVFSHHRMPFTTVRWSLKACPRLGLPGSSGERVAHRCSVRSVRPICPSLQIQPDRP